MVNKFKFQKKYIKEESRVQHIMDFAHAAEKTGFKSAQDLKRFFQENPGELFEFLYKENSQVPEIPVKK